VDQLDTAGEGGLGRGESRLHCFRPQNARTIFSTVSSATPQNAGLRLWPALQLVRQRLEDVGGGGDESAVKIYDAGEPLQLLHGGGWGVVIDRRHPAGYRRHAGGGDVVAQKIHLRYSEHAFLAVDDQPRRL
jgi:hypothetical protein